MWVLWKLMVIFAEIKWKSMKVSVITVNYNNGSGLEQTIRSVLAQTLRAYEFIIIDGGSTDGSVEVIRGNADGISYWVSERDNGIYHAMNKGVACAHGDYCLFINSGDCLYDDRVLERVSGKDYREDILVGRVVDAAGTELFTPPSRELSLYHLYSGTLAHQGAFIRTDLLRRYPYDENLKIVADWKFFVETIILHHCTFRFIEERVARFDTEGVSTTHPEATWLEKEQVLSTLFPARVLADYQYMKSAECLTQTLAPQLRNHYGADRFLYRLGKLLLRFLS